MNSRFEKLLLAGVCAGLVFSLSLRAEVVSIEIPKPSAPETGYFKLGTTKNPAGQEISVNSRSVLFDGQPVFPVMGEIHYARVPQAEWREELLKMKAGGVNIIATYVFWLHHEEIQGQWDWSGQRDLRKFIETCRELGLKVVVRCGPWCHGEARNGGLPDWVQKSGWKLRSTDTNFLAATKILYGEIAKQIKGELWKDGGPVIGIQVDNEFGGNPAYLMALKKMAVDAGIDVPLYTKTGWPAMKTPVPLGELLPLFGAYPDGFWARSIKPMDGNDWQNFTFKIQRTDTGVGNDTLKVEKSGDTSGTDKYPYLTCEIGGGMPASYHRRINYDERDVEAVVLTQLGSGSSLLGYYMYHGGQNPEGKLTTLQESTATGYANDLPVKSYDFNAPIGEFGQIYPHYYWLRRLHLFLHDFGPSLATMPAFVPTNRVTKKSDTEMLRWSVRSDGNSGYVFVNNYQRLQPMGAKTNVQFKLNLPGSELVFPQSPVTIPADAIFFWPFNMDLGGVKLIYATAQPICQIDSGPVHTFFFVETPGIKAEFAFNKTNGIASVFGEKMLHQGDLNIIYNVKPDKNIYAVKIFAGGDLKETWEIVLLNQEDSLALWKEKSNGLEQVFLFSPSIELSNQTSLASNKKSQKQLLEVYPLNPRKKVQAEHIFQPIDPTKPTKLKSIIKTSTKLIRAPGPAREIPLVTKSQIAAAPTDDDFTNAAVWQIKLPAKIDFAKNPLLRIQYIGDVARLTLNGKLIADNFYAGRPFDLGLKRYGQEIFTGDLRLEILPLRQDAPIYIEPKNRPDFGTNRTLLKLQSAEIVQ